MDMDLNRHIKELEESHLKLEVRKSPEKLDKILADDFFEIGSSGKMFGKKECLMSGVTLHEMKLHNFDIHSLAPDVVLTTYYIENKTSGINSLRSSIWKHCNGRWQLFFHQGTRTDLQIADLKFHS
ncbi:DUF4440 domain-containing protein [Thalassobacillus pellis]|uniref:nuclear transport factor 2 family protein n=1 Tax=Thalassobacillus pellis TaxID=748008 RepID=UPI0019617539|nr:DUF4440 domain-containing protein [Thalassobacillus pellis]MBM7553522.1 hypothetical protein [Thalassobacillus pellis]